MAFRTSRFSNRTAALVVLAAGGLASGQWLLGPPAGAVQAHFPPAAAEPAAPPLEDKPAAADEKEAPEKDQAALEAEFEKTLSGSVLEGAFTIVGQKEEKPPAKEKYTISKITKLEGNFWLFETRIQYGDHDVNLPLPLEVKWAGDTPVITLTDVVVPGLGTFTARVLIFRDHYAGMWSGGDHGGHLFGTITRPAAAAEPKAE